MSDAAGRERLLDGAGIGQIDLDRVDTRNSVEEIGRLRRMKTLLIHKDPKVESAEDVRDRVLEAAEFIPLSRLGTTDDCGFAPFADDTGTARETAFEKIRARIDGTKLAAEELGL